jgi:hypothetical protein
MKIIFFIFIILITAHFCSPFAIANKIHEKFHIINSYTLACSKFGTSLIDCKDDYQVFKSTYKISFESQIVVSKSTLNSLKNCEVYDKRNWSCPDKENSISMIDGWYIDTHELNENARYKTIGAFEYYQRKLISLKHSFLP